MSVLKYFKNTPSRPPIGRQALSVIFFFKFAMRSLKIKKRTCRPLGGRQGPVAQPTGDRRWARPTGPVAPPPAGDRGYPL